VNVDLTDALVIAIPATALALIVLEVGQAAGATRLDLALILGTVAPRDPDRSRVVGLTLHGVIGVAFTICYALLFAVLDMSGVAVGATIGLLHGLFVVAILGRLLPAVSNRIASPRSGPWEHTLLEPPGWFAMNYGVLTPVVVVAAHVAFGAVCGAAIDH
jgi:hypothetical protein